MAKNGNTGTNRQRATNPIFNKQLGQHVLKNPLVIQGVVDKAHLLPTDTVFEVGPGTGNITIKILEQVKQVIVVERDPRLAAELVKRVQGTEYQRKLKVIVGDVLQVDWPAFDVCISNTPFQISSPLVFRLLQHRPMFRCAVLIFQREFALRMTARPGDQFYCRLSVNVQASARVQHVMKISRNSFIPPPQVETGVVRIEPKPSVDVPFKEWDGMIRVVFGRKNKTIGACFNTNDVMSSLDQSFRTHCSIKNLPVPDEFNVKEQVMACIKKAGLEGERAAKLRLEDFTRLLACFHEAGFSFASTPNSSSTEPVDMDLDSESE
jgi:18S rRNA (adenine1779-N6/adenine1780-N6)-dimethyltransferase